MLATRSMSLLAVSLVLTIKLSDNSTVSLSFVVAGASQRAKARVRSQKQSGDLTSASAHWLVAVSFVVGAA